MDWAPDSRNLTMNNKQLVEIQWLWTVYQGSRTDLKLAIPSHRFEFLESNIQGIAPYD